MLVNHAGVGEVISDKNLKPETLKPKTLNPQNSGNRKSERDCSDCSEYRELDRLEQQIRKNTEKTLEGNPKKTLEKLWKNNKELTQHQMVG